jgi:ribose transport system permease protein
MIEQSAGVQRAEAVEATDGPQRRWGVSSMTRFSGLWIWAAFILIFGLWIPNTFFTTLTLQNVIGDQAITAIVAIGILFPLAAGAYDLSVGTTVGLSAVVTASLTGQHGASPTVALLAALGVGIAVGLANALVIVGIGVNSFIATLAMSSVLTAAISAVSKDNYIGGVPASYQGLVDHKALGVPELGFYLLVIAVVAWYVLEHTPLGRRLSATGFAPEASRLAGVRTGALTCGALVVSSVLASFAGALLTAKLTTASPNLGPPYLLPAFAAAFLGSTQLKIGRFNIWGTVLAIYLLATGVEGLQLVGAPDWVTNLFNGLALIVAVSMTLLSGRWRDRRQRGAQRARARRGA